MAKVYTITSGKFEYSGTLEELIEEKKDWLLSYLPRGYTHKVYAIKTIKSLVSLLNKSYEGTY